MKLQAASEVLRKLVVAWMKTTANYDACEAELRRTAGVSEQLRELKVKVEGMMASVESLDVAMAEAETAKHTAELLQKHARWVCSPRATQQRCPRAERRSREHGRRLPKADVTILSWHTP